MKSSEIIMESVFEPSKVAQAASAGIEPTLTSVATVSVAASATKAFPWEKVLPYALGAGLLIIIVYLIIENIRLHEELKERKKLEGSQA